MAMAGPPQPQDDSIFMPVASARERYAGLTDAEILSRITNTYTIDPSTHLHFYGTDGSQNMEIPSWNKRAHGRNIKKLGKRLNKIGIVHGVRGAMWVVKNKNPTGPYQLITWGGLTRAVA
jgi:hypothetical protein